MIWSYTQYNLWNKPANKNKSKAQKLTMYKICLSILLTSFYTDNGIVSLS